MANHMISLITSLTTDPRCLADMYLSYYHMLSWCVLTLLSDA